MIWSNLFLQSLSPLTVTRIKAQDTNYGGINQEESLGRLTSKLYSHLPTYYMKWEKTRGDTAAGCKLQQPLCCFKIKAWRKKKEKGRHTQHHLLAGRRYWKIHTKSPHESQYFIWKSAVIAEAPAAAVSRWCFFSWTYLGVILEHLVALHVVTLEHHYGSVEAGNIQTEIICADFFVRCVWEHLE